MPEESNTIQVAVLNQKVLDLKEIVLKLEEAIERISDVNSNITKMLAVHEERINNNEHNNQTLYDKVWEMSKQLESNKKEVDVSINDLTIKYNGIKNRFFMASVFVIFIGFVINNASFFENMLKLHKGKASLLTNPPARARMV